MVSEQVSDYSDLTAGQYEGKVLKREKNYKWQPYWCVLYGRQLTFYDDSQKSHVAGRIEIQPGSRCDKGQPKSKIPCLSELLHRDFTKLKKYSLKLKTKKGTHVFTYENVKEQTRWQMAMNNASQINASGVRLSWIPTPFSMVNSPEAVQNKRLSLSRTPRDCNSNNARKSEDVEISLENPSTPKSKVKSKHDDTHNLIPESDSEMTDGHAYTNPSLQKEVVTKL
jgi:hypothetical protein